MHVTTVCTCAAVPLVSLMRLWVPLGKPRSEWREACYVVAMERSLKGFQYGMLNTLLAGWMRSP